MTGATCIFCRIAAGEIPSAKLHEDEALVAFLDTNPIRTGHALIVTRAHHAYFDDLPPELAARVLHLAQRLARAQKQRYGVERVGFLFSGGDLPHVHAHVVPLVEKTDLTSPSYIAERGLTFRPAPRATNEALAATAEELKALLAG